jgi:hypothetical protein
MKPDDCESVRALRMMSSVDHGQRWSDSQATLFIEGTSVGLPRGVWVALSKVTFTVTEMGRKVVQRGC